jgi:hypothetical protein
MPDDRGPEIFICYAHEDKEFMDKLRDYIEILRYDTGARAWSDEEIRPGEKWHARIRRAMASARVVIFLVSPHAFRSDYIMTEELPAALRRMDQNPDFHLVPILVRTVPQTVHRKLRDLEWIDGTDRPLENLSENERSKVYVNLVDQLNAFLEQSDHNTVVPIPDDLDDPRAKKGDRRPSVFRFPPVPADPEDLAAQPPRGKGGQAQVLKRFMPRNRSRHRVRVWYWHNDPGRGAGGQEMKKGWVETELRPDFEHCTCINEGGFCAGYTYLVIEDLESPRQNQIPEGWYLFQTSEDVCLDIPRDFFEKAESESPPLLVRRPADGQESPSKKGDFSLKPTGIEAA